VLAVDGLPQQLVRQLLRHRVEVVEGKTVDRRALAVLPALTALRFWSGTIAS
jgi:hypothetical protein